MHALVEEAALVCVGRLDVFCRAQMLMHARACGATLVDKTLFWMVSYVKHWQQLKGPICSYYGFHKTTCANHITWLLEPVVVGDLLIPLRCLGSHIFLQ